MLDEGVANFDEALKLIVGQVAESGARQKWHDVTVAVAFHDGALCNERGLLEPENLDKKHGTWGEHKGRQSALNAVTYTEHIWLASFKFV